jgi:hypothetical protein
MWGERERERERDYCKLLLIPQNPFKYDLLLQTLHKVFSFVRSFAPQVCKIGKGKRIYTCTPGLARHSKVFLTYFPDSH